MYRKVSSGVNVKEVLTFISERALPILNPHLLAYQAKDLYKLVLYGSKISPSIRQYGYQEAFFWVEMGKQGEPQ
jgi:hypothetical protein